MRINGEMDSLNKAAAILRMTAYLLTVVFVFSAVSILCGTDTTDVYPSENGVVDLTGIAFDRETVNITSDAIYIYDLAFYTPEDFSSGKVTQEPVRISGAGPSLKDYGTLRILLKLPAGNVYVISAKNISYAQSLFINGKEYLPIGVTGDSAAAVTPKAIRYTAAFTPDGDTTELVLHYSNFVHSDTGGFYPLTLGSAQNIMRAEQLKNLRITAVTFTLVTAMLFFFGMFLFFGKSLYFLWFSLACGCIALRGLLIDDKVIMLLLPDLNWYLAIRLEYLSTCGAALFSFLYLNALFPCAASKWVLRCYTIFCALNTAFICLTPPLLFTRFATVTVRIYALFGVYLLGAILISVLYKKRAAVLSGLEQALLLAGFLIYLMLSIMGIYSHMYYINPLWGLDYPETGMMAFLFINILALVLGFSRNERALGDALMSERETAEENRMLVRLDKLRTDFFANITHDMKTPLSVIRGYAQLAIDDIEEGVVNQETQYGLAIISKEAQWLADLSDDLLHKMVEMDTKNAREYQTLGVEEILGWTVNTYRPLAQKNNNRLETHIADNLPPVRANGGIIHQVLINLMANANRHTRNGIIMLKAAFAEGEPHSGFVEISVSDNGSGIPGEILPRVFERRFSGDGGTGLGLAACKENVESHGGVISITSIPGEGTTVRFTLPRAERRGECE